MIRESATSAAANTVVSPGLSYTGATSTTSAPTTCKPFRPSRIVRSSRVLQPPGSEVPVAVRNISSAFVTSLASANETNLEQMLDPKHQYQR